VTGHLGYVGSPAASTTATSGYSQYLVLLGKCVPLAVATAAVRAYRTRLLGAWLTLAVLSIAAIIAAVSQLSGTAHQDHRQSGDHHAADPKIPYSNPGQLAVSPSST
jgi:hypothetical protein